jgi:hypothetical protein
VSPNLHESWTQQESAKFHVRMWLKANLENKIYKNLKAHDIIIVWFSRTLQNWKALVITSLPDGLYFEVTYNGDKKETYLDIYKKLGNLVIPDDENPNRL